MTDRPSPLAPFQHATYRSIWLANLASSFGGLIQAVGAAWLMTSISNSVDMVALVQASTTLPIMMFSLLGGAIADSFNRRGVMLGAQLFMLVVSVALALGTWFGLMTPWLLLAFTFLIGCGTALNNPSWHAAVGDMVPRDDLPAAVALNSVGFNLSRSVGPAVGGAIIALAGTAAAFAVNAVSYLGLVAVLLRWRPPASASTLPREAIGPAMLAGLRYVGMSPNIGNVLLRSFVFGLTAIIILALLPVVSAVLLGGGPFIYGLMLCGFGLGAVGGALVSGNMHARLGSESVVRIAFAGFAITAWITAISTSPWLTGFAMLIGGACWVLALSLFNVTVQLSSPRWVVGRALSLYQTASFGGMALGSWIWGLVAEHYGLSVALAAAGACMLAGGALGLRLPLPARLTANLDPWGRWQEPHLELALEERSGPIVVEIEYLIRPSDVPAFLDIMADRRRVRRRDGARHWVLMRDLGQPERWVESYRTATWTEYVRHNQRRTQADAVITDRIRALHSGAEPPRVRRMIERPPDWFAAVAGIKDTTGPS
ncbi:MFS transporter [Devosia sp.]|uniref:MFS transporter n=1 Tax=Devosia sp. TaxID=1871048 RepID=UPI002F2449D7